MRILITCMNYSNIMLKLNKYEFIDLSKDIF